MKNTKVLPLVRTLLPVVGAILLLAGCATQQTALTDPQNDPWEPFNRNVYQFNDALDRALLRPVARGYDAIMPDGPQRGVRNFFRNLAYPVDFLNLVLQGKFEDSMTRTGRFLMNSTLGLFGFFDVATQAGMPDFQEDFGQTLAVWGWKDSRYLVVPLLGPFTVRDLGGRPVDSIYDPVTYLIREEDEYRPLIVDLISLRASLLPFDKDLEEASDPYVLMRDVYLQNREYKIYDGEPPAPDYDALLEE
ncbi:MlaA family lipoprotein [Elongatibacter sediminis]|uniref:VacJ family lipoprotein n=1 Tax=Elongatibacter sediminis TaxID=3119006 RepID=A0AAW9RE74_9GAMM